MPLLSILKNRTIFILSLIHISMGADAVAVASAALIAAACHKEVKVHTLTGTGEAKVQEKAGMTEIQLTNVPVYAAVELL